MFVYNFIGGLPLHDSKTYRFNLAAVVPCGFARKAL